MGVVYKAEDTRLGRNVALKFLPEKLAKDHLTLERFRREARAASALNHPNICTIHDIGDHEGQPFIVMEFLEGQTLRHHLQNGPLPTDQLLDFGIQIAEALSAAHFRGILHRDIKPDNVFVTVNAQIKLLDFGLAKLLAQGPESAPGIQTTDSSQESLTATGIAVGTPYYMSPDQLQDKVLDNRSDVFSLGVLLYEMATGTLPFQGSNLVALLNEILHKVPALPTQLNPELPESLGQVLKKALEKDPDVRHQSAKDLMADLKHVRQDPHSTSTLIPAPTATNRVQPSIAVLPFVNMSPDPENEYFSDGLAEELINSLTKLKGLRVAARTSAFSFKGMRRKISDIGKQLSVATILEGSVRKSGNQLRITVQLVNASDGYHLWSERYDREMEDIFKLQDEIAQQIVEKLQVELAKGSGDLLRKRYTENLEAYNLYLKGRYHLNQRTEQSTHRAIDCFQRAASEDSRYALAYAGLGEAYVLLGTGSYYGTRPSEALSKAKKTALRAIELEESCAEAHVALALVYFRADWDWKRAEEEFCRAISLNESLATGHHQYAMVLATQLRFDEALTEIQRAHELDPLSPIISTAVGRILYFARRFEEAIDQCSQTLELNPQFAVTYFDLAVAYALKGRYAEAASAAKKFGALSQNQELTKVALAVVYGMSGERGKAVELVNALIESAKNRYVSPYILALGHVHLGDLNRVIELLEEGYVQRESKLVYLLCEPAWDPLRDDPRFQDLLRRMNLEA